MTGGGMGVKLLTLGLGDEEPHEQEHAETEAAEDEVGTVEEKSKVSPHGYRFVITGFLGGHTHPYPLLPTVMSMVGTARATTKLNSHCVAAARDTLRERSRADGISLA